MKRDEFKANAKKSIDEIFAKIEELEAKKDEVKGEAKTRYKEKLDELKRKKDELEAKYKNIEEVSEAKWEEAKNAFYSAYNRFKHKW